MGGEPLPEDFKWMLSVEDFKERTRMDLDPEAEFIIPLRNVPKIKRMEDMKQCYLEALLRTVPTNDKKHIPFQNAEFQYYEWNPSNIRAPQTFVQIDKLVNLLDLTTTGIFADYGYTGFTRLTPKVVYSEINETLYAALYVPPIIEQHDGDYLLLDGVHRSSLVRGTGGSMRYIVIKDVNVEFPTTPRPWEDVQKVQYKPPMEERYENLKPELFRDLKYVGIDG